MIISLIAALSANHVIGRGNQLPWHLPEDLRYFKRMTLGKPVIMGRKTFDSIGRPLPGRLNIVVTRQASWQFPGVVPARSLEAALEVAAGSTRASEQEAELMIMGGAQIYALALPLAQRLYLTEVHAQVDGDAWFPALVPEQWQATAREDHQASGDNPFDYSFVIYERKPPGRGEPDPAV